MGMFYSKCPNCKSMFWFNDINFTKGGSHMPKCTLPRLVKCNPDEVKAHDDIDPSLMAKLAEAMKDPNIMKKLKEVARF